MVDDSVIMRKNLQTLLTQAGHEVVGEAGTGQEAVERYERLRPDLVTMDITMPGMDGVTAVKAIASRFPEARIIMISAENQKSLVYEALKSGARHYLTKPLRLNKLADVLNSVLEKPADSGAGAEPALATVEHKSFRLTDLPGRVRVDLSADFAPGDCVALRAALEPLTSTAPLKLELATAPNLAWNRALAKALFEVLSAWQQAHGPATWVD